MLLTDLSIPRENEIRPNSPTSLAFLTGSLFSIGREQQCERQFFSLQNAGFCCPGLFHAPVAFAEYIYRAQVILNMRYIWDVKLIVMRAGDGSVRETNLVPCQFLKLKSSELWIGTAVQGFEFYGAG